MAGTTGVVLNGEGNDVPMLIDPTVYQVIDRFVQKELRKHTELEAIILCGSQAAGNATVHSDIDLCYIGQFPSFRREYQSYKEYDFQLMIAPWDWYAEVIRSYERKGNIGTITIMIAQGYCLWTNKNDTWKKLREEAVRSYLDGPARASVEELLRHKRLITELWTNYIDLDDSLSVSWMISQIIHQCVESHFLIQNWWAVKPKHQMRYIQDRDPSMAVLLAECYDTYSRTSLSRLCEHVLSPIDGME